MAELERTIGSLRTELERQREHLEKQHEHGNALERENKILREELALLRQHMPGRRTARIEPGQLGLFSNEGLE